MKSKKIILISVVLVTALMAVPFTIFANDVTVPSGEEITVSLTGGLNFTIQAGSTAASIEVADSSFTITTGSTDGVTIKSSTGKRMENNGNLATTCEGSSGISTISVGPSKIVIFTPSGALECSNTPSAGGGSGGMIAPVTTSRPPATTQPPDKIPMEEVMFKDMTKDNETYIIPLVKLMLAQNTYKMPLNKIYGTNSITKGSFAIQALLAVAGKNCGSVMTYTNSYRCKTAALRADIIDSTFPIGNVNRLAFYKSLLNAKGIALKKYARVSDLKKVCKDVASDVTVETAKIFLTAKAAGIAGIYTGGKCRLNLAFSKTEAAKFAMRAVRTKAK